MVIRIFQPTKEMLILENVIVGPIDNDNEDNDNEDNDNEDNDNEDNVNEDSDNDTLWEAPSPVPPARSTVRRINKQGV